MVLHVLSGHPVENVHIFCPIFFSGVGGDAAQVQNDVQRWRHRLLCAAQPHRLRVGDHHGRSTLHEPQEVGRPREHQVKFLFGYLVKGDTAGSSKPPVDFKTNCCVTLYFNSEYSRYQNM